MTSFRKASEKTPADVRALWDWFYLCLLRYDNAAAFAAAKMLSRAATADPLALWAYLYSLGSRQQTGQASRYVVGQGTGRRTPLRRLTKPSSITCWPASRRCEPGGPSWPRPRSSRTSSRS